MRTKKLSTKAQALQQVPLFSRCAADELELAASLVDETVLKAGYAMTREGAPGMQAFIIVSGTAAVDVGGQRIATLGPGDPVGEMALLDRAPRSATVIAETDVRVLVLTESSLDRLVAETAVARSMLAALARRLRQSDSALHR